MRKAQVWFMLQMNSFTVDTQRLAYRSYSFFFTDRSYSYRTQLFINMITGIKPGNRYFLVEQSTFLYYVSFGPDQVRYRCLLAPLISVGNWRWSAPFRHHSAPCRAEAWAIMNRRVPILQFDCVLFSRTERSLLFILSIKTSDSPYSDGYTL